jgi:antitoxin FitA
MRNITVKNIPNDVYDQLKQSAKINRRSINQEIIVCIENSIQGTVIEPQHFIDNARRLRKITADHPISNEELNRVKGIKRL